MYSTCCVGSLKYRPIKKPFIVENHCKKQLRSIVIKPTGSFCNLKCHYCFYLDRHHLYAGTSSTHRMSEATLEKMIDDMFICCDNPTFVWQGGEPTVLGVDFFRKAVQLQRQYAQGRAFANALQTHAGLIDDEWVNFLLQEQFLVGVSLDGPAHVHDRYRRDAQGRGTFHQVFPRIQKLLKAGVPVNVLATVTDYSVAYPEEIYAFFRDYGLVFMQFSPVVEYDSENPGQAAPYSVDARRYGRFLRKIFSVWLKDFDFDRLKQKTSVRFFDSLLQCYLGMEPDHCALHSHCNDYLVVEHNGDLFSCDFFVEKEAHLGNLHHQRLQEVFNSPKHLVFGQSKASYDETCRQCQWLKLCYGGCIKDRIRDPRDKGHNRFCESYQYFFSRVHPHFERLAGLYRRYYLNQ